MKFKMHDIVVVKEIKESLIGEINIGDVCEVAYTCTMDDIDNIDCMLYAYQCHNPKWKYDWWIEEEYLELKEK